VSVRMRGADRLWMAAGAAVALALAALSWVFLISPQNSETDGLRAEVDQVNDRVVALQARLAQLRKENEKLPEHQAKLAAQRQALPTATALSNFLREMQTAGERTGVSVSAVNTGAAGKTQAGGAEIQVLPVTLTVDGGIDGQLAFLDELQHVQPRAVLIIDPMAIFDAVTSPAPASTAISSRNFPNLLSPICRNGRSSDARM